MNLNFFSYAAAIYLILKVSNISFRRMVYTQDPDWPCVAVTGNLPKLVVHISEQKVTISEE